MGGFRWLLATIVTLMLGMSLLGCDGEKNSVDSLSTSDLALDAAGSFLDVDGGNVPLDAATRSDADGGNIPLDAVTSEGADGAGLASCGDGECGEGEDPCTCPDDCMGYGACCHDYDCPQPQCGPCCIAECHDFECAEVWLNICCGDEVCDEGENWEDCPEDCPEPNPCGDGECGDGEDPCTCPEDCLTDNACCSDDDCPLLDCGPCCYVPCVNNECVGTAWLPNCCWNGECEEGEDWESCPADCPEPTECVKEGGTCVLWTPGGSCDPGFEEVGFMCESKSEACCMAKPVPQCEELFGCESDDDCVKTDGDCCGCAAGGFSVAVAVACLEQWHNAMECSPDIGCLGVYFCDDSVAACVDGVCDLVTPPDPVE